MPLRVLKLQRWVYRCSSHHLRKHYILCLPVEIVIFVDSSSNDITKILCFFLVAMRLILKLSSTQPLQIHSFKTLSFWLVVSTFLLFVFFFIFTSLRLYLSSSLCPNVLMSFLNVAFSCFCLFVFPPHIPFCFLVFLSFCNLLKCLMDGQRGRLYSVPKNLLVENPGDTMWH